MSITFDKIFNSSIYKVIGEYKREIFWIFVASSIVNLLMLAPMIYMLQIFDRVFNSKNALTLGAISLVVIYLYFVTGFSEWIRSQFIIRIGLKIDKNLNERLFYSAFKNKIDSNIPDPLFYLNDLMLVRQWMTGPAVFTVFDFPWVPVYIYVMFMLHEYLGYLSILLIFILIIIGWITAKVMGTSQDLLQQEEQNTNQFIYNKLRNAEVIKVFGLATKFKKPWFLEKAKFYVNLSRREKKSGKLFHFSKQFRLFTASLALAVGAILVMANELSLAAMIAAALLMQRTTSPVDQFTSTLSNWNSIKAAFARINDLLKENENILSGKNYLDKDEDTKKLSVIDTKKLSVEIDDNLILDNINLTFKAGEVTAILGATGSGKTTLSKILVGIWNKYDGSVEYDKINIKEFHHDDFSKMVGYLPQAVMLYGASVSENIASMRIPNATRVIEVAKMVGIHDFILKLPKGYDTFVNSGTTSFSGGERQRIGIARAIYNDPNFIVLDEPNSSLDQNGEKALANVLNIYKEKGSIIVVISHRRSILESVDNVVRIDRGKILLTKKKDDYIKQLQKSNEKETGKK